MKILKMKLENFQGVKELEIDPQGESSAIYGDNGTGKSTVYNAFTWLMYGKPSTTEKNYTPKTTGSHNLHHSVEMTVELADGSEMVLKKDYHEVYKTIKGNPQPVLSGHTTDYSMDGVPVSETQFKKNLLEIYHDEELAKMLTSYNYFLENMKVADRRKILLQVCGDADFNEVIESQGDLLRELPEMLRKPGKAENYYTVDEYRAIAAKEKNLTDKELAYNDCYVKGKQAMYRNYSVDMPARELIRAVYQSRNVGMPREFWENDEVFDEIMMDNLQYGYDTFDGLMAMLYQQIWSKAEMREVLLKVQKGQNIKTLV